MIEAATQLDVEWQISDRPISWTRKQYRFLNSTKPILCLSGAVGAGKTLPGCCKAIQFMVMHPGCFGLIGAPTHPQLRDSTLRTFFQVCPPELIANYNKSEGIVRLKANRGYSEITFRPLYSEIRTRGPNLSMVYIDEAAGVAKDVFYQLIGRLRETADWQLFCTTNPDSLSHWCYTDIVSRQLSNDEASLQGKRLPFPDTETIFVSTWENQKHLPSAYLRVLDDTFKGDFRERFLEGRWGSYEGLIYNNFKKEKHIINDREFPPDFDKLPVYLGGDWGHTNPTAVVFSRYANGTYYIFDEYYQSGLTPDENAINIRRILDKHSIPLASVAGFFVDPSAAHFMDSLMLNGLRCHPAKNDVWPGIVKVVGLLGDKKQADDSKLLISHRCRNLILEFQSYKINPKALVKETPLKADDHLLDALRYLVFTREFYEIASGVL